MIDKTIHTLTRSVPVDIATQHITTNSDVIYHNHDFFEYTYVLEGKGLYILNDREIEISAGNFFIADCNVVHSYNVNDDNGLKIRNICFRPEFIDETLRTCRDYSDLMLNYLIKYKLPLSDTDPTDTIFFDSDKKILSLFNDAYNEYNMENDVHFEVMRGYIIILTINILRHFGANTYQTYSPHSIDIFSYISKNYTDNTLSLNMLSNKFSYSPAYLCRLIKKRFRHDLYRISSQYSNSKRLPSFVQHKATG